MPFWRSPPLLGRRKQLPTRGPSVGPWKWAAACPVCGVGSHQSLASETRSSGTAATVSVVCVAATQRWFLTTSMAGNMSQIPEHTVTDAEHHHPVAPCLEQEPSPCQCWPPAGATSLTQSPPLLGSGSPRDRMERNPHACSPMCLPGMSPVPVCPWARASSAARPCWPVAPLFPRVNRTQQPRRLQSGEGFWLTLAGKQRWRRSAQPPKRGAGGQSAPQAWVEVDPEETPPPREPTCYCRNSQRNSRLG